MSPGMLVLSEFDVKKGNQVVWTSQDVDPKAITGIEFQMIPSGLHDSEEDTIYFHIGEYEGCAVFSAKHSLDNPSDRSVQRIYALAMLDHKLPWNQESFLRLELEKFMSVEDTAVLPQAPGQVDTQSHAVLSMTQFISWYGPLCFELWKAALARERLILRSHLPIREMSKFTYLISRLAMIPTDTQHLLPEYSREMLEYPCYYNVTLLDLAKLQSTRSFCATTTDDVLLIPSRDACDAWASQDKLHIGTTTVTSTWRDRYKFRQLLKDLDILEVSNKSSWSFLDNVVDSTARGLIWWASAGDPALLQEEHRPLLDEAPAGVAVIGAFHGFTRQLIQIFAAAARDCDEFVILNLEDLSAMGLDPTASSDRQFLQKFAKTWWDRPVRFRGLCSCCM